ncbi:MAG: transaldolase, partial [Ignavibacteria bacterium]|nr:transaldolase [Ignavibacteria bacterium]
KKANKKFDKNKKFNELLKYFFEQKKSGDYFAMMAYLQKSKENEKILKNIRELIKNKLKVATTVGYGPRFLHSTGQLHKGGANNGMYLQIICDDVKDLEIPGKPYSFSVLKQSQAIGDYESLLKHNRRTLKINIGRNKKKGLEELFNSIKKVL